MASRAQLGSASVLARLILLMGCGVGAFPDVELLMQAPFAPGLNWTDAASMCNSTSMRANVTCDDHGHVTSLVIFAPASEDAANVTLPHWWGSLTHLRTLDVTGAVGTLPPDWGNAGSFPQLQKLVVSQSSLSGSLPSGWDSSGSFPLLKVLYLYNNTLSGSIPQGWCNSSSFPELRELSLLNNSLTGSLPPEWGSNGSFTHLWMLSLQINSLNGSLPPTWGSSDSFPRLNRLYLWKNSLSGSLPLQWGSNGSFMQLQTLSLASNNLSGSLPLGWGSNGSFRELQELILSNNILTGTLPPDWFWVGNFWELKKLSLDNNTLTGSLPPKWASGPVFQRHLHALLLDKNTLSGTLPPEWGEVGYFTELQKLSLSNNALSGSLPKEWGSKDSFPQLQSLYLHNFFLNGSLPGEWGSNGSFLQLSILHLRNNRLSGSLPAEWGVSKDLNMLTLQDIYKAAAPFKSVKHLLVSKNNFTGGVPLEWTNNPHFISGCVFADVTQFQASRVDPEFGRGICLDSYRYGVYRNWSYEIKDECRDFLFTEAPEYCYKRVRENEGLDPCSLAPTTRVLLIALWSCFGAVVLLVCLEERLVKLLRQLPETFQESVKRYLEPGKKKAMDWMDNRLSSRHRFLLGMMATVIAFWADIASDVPVIVESWGKKGVYFFVLVGLMLGSHILDAILVARYAVARGGGESGHNQSLTRNFSCLLQGVVSFTINFFVPRGVGDILLVGLLAPGVLFFCSLSIVFAWLEWYLVYFLVAVLALPALDVLGLVNPSRPQPPDSVFKVNLQGYQTMRLVIGAVFRTVPTAIVLTVIAARGNNPDNGTYFDSKVVSVSLTLSAVQIIIVILQVRYRAKAQGMSKLELLRSVFTLDGLSLLSDQDPSQSPEHKDIELKPVSIAADSQSSLEGCPLCEGTGLLKPKEKEP